MYRYVIQLLICFFLLLLAGCAGDNFDEATIPKAQLSTELAFKRMADHGEIEPVVEIDQEITDWQFHIAGYSKAAFLNGTPTIEYTLRDRSGIKYTVSSESTPEEVLANLETGQYIYATGKIASVERDFTGGKLYATLVLSSWRKRD